MTPHKLVYERSAHWILSRVEYAAIFPTRLFTSLEYQSLMGRNFTARYVQQ